MKKIIKQYLKEQKGLSRSKIIKAMDHLVSQEVKRLAGGKCERCHRPSPKTGCSHYFSRRYIGTRWNLENLCWLDWGCHYNWAEKEKNPGGWYYDFMLKRLGEKKFEALKVKAYGVNRWPTSDLEILLDQFRKGKFI